MIAEQCVVSRAFYILSAIRLSVSSTIYHAPESSASVEIGFAGRIRPELSGQDTRRRKVREDSIFAWKPATNDGRGQAPGTDATGAAQTF